MSEVQRTNQLNKANKRGRAAGMPRSEKPRRLRRLNHGRIPYLIDCAISKYTNPGDSLIVSGFWRSGTTWLQESVAKIVGAKTIFEPFHPLVSTNRTAFSDHVLRDHDEHFLELHMPYCNESLPAKNGLHNLFEKSLRATVPGSAVRVLRSSPLEACRSRVVVKVVRGHLCLRAAQNEFAMPIIHVYRDPRAIVASVRDTDWAWLFEHLNLEEQLLAVEDGRRRSFETWHDDILSYDRQDIVTKLTAYWALTEKYLQNCYSGGSERTAFVPYESLSRNEITIQSTLGGLNVPYLQDAQLVDKDSYSTSAVRRGTSIEERNTAWKKKLTTSEVRTIESIVERFGFEDRLVDVASLR